MEYAPEGELFDQVLRESEEETLMNEVTAKLSFRQISPYYIVGECSRTRFIWPSDARVRESDNIGKYSKYIKISYNFFNDLSYYIITFLIFS